MNTKTIFNFKTDKKLKAAAQKNAGKMGVPLSTIMNAFLRQFVNDKEVTFSLKTNRMTPYLENIIIEAKNDWKHGTIVGPFKSGKEMDAYLDS